MSEFVLAALAAPISMLPKRLGKISGALQRIKTDDVLPQIIYVDESKKRDCLFDLLLSMPPARTIIFVNNKKAADFLDDFLYNRQLPSTSIHSDRTQREREDAL